MVEKYKGRIQKPIRVTEFQRYQTEEEIKKEFEKCFKNKCLLVAVFCQDDSWKERIKLWIEKEKKLSFYTAVVYITPAEIKTDDELFEKLAKGFEGEDIFEEKGENDDLDILYDGQNKNVVELYFNQPGSQNHRMFSTTAKPITTQHFIEGDGNCGFRSIAHLLTGNF